MSRRHKTAPNAMSSIFVETTQTKFACQRIDELIRDGWEENHCLGLLLYGLSRSGKSRLVDDYMETRIGREWPADKVRPIVYVEVPPNCTLKSFATAVLMALRDPDPEYGDQVARTRRIGVAVQKHGVELLVFDEFQRLIDADTDKLKKNVAIWVSGLLNQGVCPLLLVGEPKATHVFIDNDHLEGRTLGPVEIYAYDWADLAHRREFATILHNIDTKLGMPELSDLGKMRMAQRIHEFAQGRLGQATRLVGHARRIAQRLGRPKLTDDLFEQAVDELRIGTARKRTNPFRAAEVN